MFRPDKIIVHHSLTSDGPTVSWGAIRKYHTDPNGPYKMLDIGYHAGVELVDSGGISHMEVLIGRWWFKTGAHTLGENATSLGFCFVGNYDVVPPPDEMLEAGARLLATWCRLFVIDPGRIFPHSAFENKTCPGTQFPMAQLRARVREITTGGV
jgi:N-acetylmuramoyl-L-alanine amidase